MKATSLNFEQCWSIASFLRTAAGRFDEFAKMAMNPPENTKLRDQFKLQSTQAQQFAGMFENAEFAHLQEEE